MKSLLGLSLFINALFFISKGIWSGNNLNIFNALSIIFGLLTVCLWISIAVEAFEGK